MADGWTGLIGIGVLFMPVALIAATLIIARRERDD